MNPNYADTHNERGNTYCKAGDYERAIQDYNKAIALDPNHASAYNNRGIAYYKKGDYEQAIIDYTKTIELDPDDATAYYNRGEALLHLSKWEEAKADLTTATEKGANIVGSFQKEYKSVVDFKKKHGIQLPPNIVEMLMPTHS